MAILRQRHLHHIKAESQGAIESFIGRGIKLELIDTFKREQDALLAVKRDQVALPRV